MRVLSDLAVGESGVLVALELPLGVQNHLMHMGFVTDAEVKALHKAPAGDPTVYSVDGIEIALRRETARAIQIRTAVRTGDGLSLTPDRGTLLEVASKSEDALIGFGDERLLHGAGVCPPGSDNGRKKRWATEDNRADWAA